MTDKLDPSDRVRRGSGSPRSLVRAGHSGTSLARGRTVLRKEMLQRVNCTDLHVAVIRTDQGRQFFHLLQTGEGGKMCSADFFLFLW